MVGVRQLSWFGYIVEATDAWSRLAHSFTVEAAAVKVGQLLSVVLLIFIGVIVVGSHDII